MTLTSTGPFLRRRGAALVLAVSLAVLVFAAGVAAQDRIFAFRGAFQDVGVSHPCGADGLKGAASMTVYDTNAWIVFTCADDRVVLRRYFNPNDNARPTPALPQCPVGFVHTKDGHGCVPPNHPLAR